MRLEKLLQGTKCSAFFRGDAGRSASSPKNKTILAYPSRYDWRGRDRREPFQNGAQYDVGISGFGVRVCVCVCVSASFSFFSTRSFESSRRSSDLKICRQKVDYMMSAHL